MLFRSNIVQRLVEIMQLFRVAFPSMREFVVELLNFDVFGVDPLFVGVLNANFVSLYLPAILLSQMH